MPAWYGVDRTQVRSIVESVVLEIGPFFASYEPMRGADDHTGRQHRLDECHLHTPRTRLMHYIHSVPPRASRRCTATMVFRPRTCHVVMEGGLRDALRRAVRVVCYNQGHRASCPNRITTSLSSFS